MKAAFLTIFYSAVFTLLLSGCGKSNAQTALKAIPIDMSFVNEDLNLQEIKDLNGGDVEIIYFPASEENIPKEIGGVFSTRNIFTEEDALYSLLSVRTFMGIEDASFICTKIDDSGEYKRFELMQLYKGLAVVNGGFTIHASKENGSPVSVTGFYVPNLNLDIVPKITEKEARKSVKKENFTKITETQLVVYGTYGASEPASRLAFKFHVWGKDIANTKDVYVDAVTGKVIAEYPAVIS